MYHPNLYLYLHMAFPPVSVYKSPFFYRDINHWIRLHPNPVWPHLDYICKDLISKLGHFQGRRVWVEINLGMGGLDTIQPSAVGFIVFIEFGKCSAIILLLFFFYSFFPPKTPIIEMLDYLIFSQVTESLFIFFFFLVLLYSVLHFIFSYLSVNWSFLLYRLIYF